MEYFTALYFAIKDVQGVSRIGHPSVILIEESNLPETNGLSSDEYEVQILFRAENSLSQKRGSNIPPTLE